MSFLEFVKTVTREVARRSLDWLFGDEDFGYKSLTGHAGYCPNCHRAKCYCEDCDCDCGGDCECDPE